MSALGDTTQFVKQHTAKASWKTSMAGLLSIFSGVGLIARMIQDKDWNGEHLMAALGLISAGLTGLFARDNNKSSEDAGIRGEVPPPVVVKEIPAIAKVPPPLT